MPSSDSSPKEPNFVERVFDQKYLLFLSCLGLFLDILHRYFFGSDISFFKLKDIDDKMTYGSLFIVGLAYLYLMSWMPRLRRSIKQLLWKPLCWLYVKDIQLPIAPEWISIYDLKQYAREHGSSILWEEIKEREKLHKKIDFMNDLRFSLCLFLGIDIWMPGCFSHKVINMMPELWPQITSILLSLLLIKSIGESIIPFDHYDDYLYLSDHPLAEKQRAMRRKHDEEMKKYGILGFPVKLTK